METNAGLSPLRGLMKLRDARTRRFSSYDRTGGNDDRLHIRPGETITIAETKGAGIVTHIWMTLQCNEELHHLRKTILRAYWDGEDSPSIECPVGDFFGMGHAATRNFASLPLQMSPQDGRALNCYFPMPFEKSMRFSITNECGHELLFYYYIDLEVHERLEPGLGRFHAQWRREITTEVEHDAPTNEIALFGGVNTDGVQNYVILDAKGHGHYVGCLLSHYNLRRSVEWDWYGEGDDMLFIDDEPGISVPDGHRRPQVASETPFPVAEPRPASAPGANDAWPPTLHGTGTEDYFNTAWCPSQDYSAPYHGIIAGGGHNWTEPVTLYRFHIEDPVVFKRAIKVSIEHGHANRRSDELSSVAFWYQVEPHQPFPPLPPVAERLPIFRRPNERR